MNTPQELYAVELNITEEARVQGRLLKKDQEYWVIHSEADNDGSYHLCVYDTAGEAREEARGRDHEARVVKFIREVKP
jgi:hypothetical protein